MARTSSKWTLDATDYSAVIRCRRCAWRGLSHNAATAYRQVAAHCRRVHDDLNGEYRAHKLAAEVGGSHMPAEVPAETPPGKTATAGAGRL